MAPILCKKYTNVQFIRELTSEQISNQLSHRVLISWKIKLFFSLLFIIRNVQVSIKPRGIKTWHFCRESSAQYKSSTSIKERRGRWRFFPSIIIQSAHVSPCLSVQPQIHPLLFHENVFHILILWLDCQWKHSSALPQQSTQLTFIHAAESQKER